jgi:hypothetical protein
MAKLPPAVEASRRKLHEQLFGKPPVGKPKGGKPKGARKSPPQRKPPAKREGERKSVATIPSPETGRPVPLTEEAARESFRVYLEVLMTSRSVAEARKASRLSVVIFERCRAAYPQAWKEEALLVADGWGLDAPLLARGTVSAALAAGDAVTARWLLERLEPAFAPPSPGSGTVLPVLIISHELPPAPEAEMRDVQYPKVMKTTPAPGRTLDRVRSILEDEPDEGPELTP